MKLLTNNLLSLQPTLCLIFTLVWTEGFSCIRKGLISDRGKFISALDSLAHATGNITSAQSSAIVVWTSADGTLFVFMLRHCSSIAVWWLPQASWKNGALSSFLYVSMHVPYRPFSVFYPSMIFRQWQGLLPFQPNTIMFLVPQV